MPRITANALIEIVERAVHASPGEWLFFHELCVGTGRKNGAAQRLDAFALKTLKRRVGMRYSNEFYFVTPAGLAQQRLELAAGPDGAEL